MVHTIGEHYTMEINSKAKSTGIVAITGVVIAAVTLALITAAVAAIVVVIVSVNPIIQTAHAKCIASPKGDQACSGGSPFLGGST